MYIKFHRSLCVPFSRTAAGLCIYHLFILSNLNFLHISQSLSLFNGISTFVGYLMPKPFSEKNSSGEDKEVHTFPKGICPKVNVIARLEFELAYYDSEVHRFNHYSTRTPPHISQWITLPTQSCLVLYYFCANLLHLLVIDGFLSVTAQPTLAISLHLIYSRFDMISSYGVILCCYSERFGFFLKVFFSYQRPRFLVWGVVISRLKRP